MFYTGVLQDVGGRGGGKQMKLSKIQSRKKKQKKLEPGGCNWFICTHLYLSPLPLTKSTV